MSEIDEAITKIEVSDIDGKVLLKFSKDTRNLVMDPENARVIAEGIAKAAYKARYGHKPTGGEQRSIISEQIRMRMINRCTHVIRSLQDQKKMPGYIANHVIDIVLSEVT